MEDIETLLELVKEVILELTPDEREELLKKWKK